MNKLCRILVVDDDPPVRRAIIRMLRPLQAAVFEADNGLDALLMRNQALDSNGDFDLIVSDMQMPGMDGAELHNRLQRAGFVMQRFVLCSGGMNAEQRSFIAGQKIKLLEKPIDPDKFLELVRTLLSP